MTRKKNERITSACYRVIPDNQVVTLEIQAAPGAMLRADLVGSTIRNMGRVLRACSDQVGTHEEVFVTGIKMSTEGKLQIEFASLPPCSEEG